jgi:hypothetical protein
MLAWGGSEYHRLVEIDAQSGWKEIFKRIESCHCLVERSDKVKIIEVMGHQNPTMLLLNPVKGMAKSKGEENSSSRTTLSDSLFHGLGLGLGFKDGSKED